VGYAKVARQLCLTNGQPRNERCEEVGKPLRSDQPDWEHVKGMTGGYEFIQQQELTEMLDVTDQELEE